MKVVLDTNVLVSGMLFAGPPNKILRAWSERRLRIAVSPDIDDEYRRVAARFHAQFPKVDIRALLDVVLAEAEMCQPAPLEDRVSPDPADDKFIACAIASSADAVVSGDRHLRVALLPVELLRRHVGNSAEQQPWAGRHRPRRNG